jgi:salicylate hydroxylase
MQNFHVAIIGAGLGGLCLAQALKRAGVAFDVYERDPSPASRAQGYRIRVDTQGQRALSEALSPPRYRLFHETASIAPATCRFLTPELESFPGPVPGSWQADGDGEEAGADLVVNRQTLREILMAGIEERIHFNYAFDACAVADDGRVAVGFQHRRAPILSSVLVGADGVNSRVRALLAPDAEPDDTGSLCIYGRTALREDVPGEPSTGTRVIFAGGCAAILDEMRFRAPLPLLAARIAPECVLTPVGDYLYWALIGPRERFGPTASGLRDTAAPDVHALLQSVTADWHPTLRRIVCDTDPSTIAMLPVRSGRPATRWSAGPVPLLGDAIPAMSPAGGLGANTALRDAVALAEVLAEAAAGHAATVPALSRYEARMRRWADAAVTASRQGSDRLFQATPAAPSP